jgi:hypothetical protein
MRRNKMPVWIVLLVVAAQAILCSGCQKTKSRAPSLTKGAVDLDRLMTLNPDYARVRLLDRLIASEVRLRGTTAQPLTAPKLSLQDLAALNSSFTPSPEEDDAFASRLLIADKSWSDRLSQRLAVSNESAAQYARQEAVDAAWKQYRQQYENLSNVSSDSLMKIMREQTDKFTRLNLQLMVLKLNADPASPKTAPDGYWAQRLLEKMDERNALMVLSQEQIDKLTAVQQAQERDLREGVDADAAAKIAEAEAKLHADLSERVAGYNKLLSGRRAAVLETARDFDREMIASIDAESTAPGEAAQLKASGISQRDLDQEEWGAGLAKSIERLRQQRARQYDLVREETRRVVLDIASRERLQVVDWKPAAGRRDLTSLIMRESAILKLAQ